MLMTDPAAAEILSRLDRFESDVTTRFNRIDERFSRIDERFSHIDEHITRIDARLAHLDQFESDVAARFNRVDPHLHKIEAKLDEKPSHADVWRSSATLIALAFALVGGTVAVLEAACVIA